MQILAMSVQFIMHEVKRTTISIITEFVWNHVEQNVIVTLRSLNVNNLTCHAKEYFSASDAYKSTK